MEWFNILVARLRGLLQRDAIIRDIEEELRFHLEMETQTLVERGMGLKEAWTTALCHFGNLGRIKELAYEIRGGGMIDTLWQDIRYGMRMLTRNLGFTSVAMLTLALGIGANTAIFSVVNAVILRPLPYQKPDRLAMLWTDDSKRDLHEASTSYPTFLDWRNQSQFFAEMAIFKDDPLILTSADESERVMGTLVSANLFSLLGVNPVLGRAFTKEEEEREEQVVVLSYGLWQRRFGGDPHAIGKMLDLTTAKGGRNSAQIIGVMPEGFDFPSKESQLWEPKTVYWRWQRESVDRYMNSWRVVGRLKPQASFREAQREMTAIGHQLAQTYPSSNPEFPGFAVNIVPLLDQITGKNLQLALWVLLGAVGFVLLIACVNVANLLLARGAAREREFAIRAALGAGRGRLLRQLLTESAMLTVGAGLLGLGLAAASVRILTVAATLAIPRLNEVRLDTSVLLFTIGLCLLSGLLFGMVPAWKISQLRPNEALKRGGKSASKGLRLHQTRGLLVMMECALAMVLLTGAGLLLRSFLRIQSVNPGFKPEGVLLVRIAPPLSVRDGRSAEAYYQQIRENVSRLSGVQAVDTIDGFLIRGNPDESIKIEGRPVTQEGETSQLANGNVSPGFFRTMGVPLVRGRFFSRDDAVAKCQLLSTPTLQGAPSDVATRAPAEATIINETFARRFFPGEDPIGKRFYFGEPTKIYWYEIVGIVGDMHRQGLEKQVIPEYFGPHIGGTSDMIVRVNSDPIAFAATIREATRSVDKKTMILSVTTVEKRLGELSAQRQFQTWLLAIFAAQALILATIGIYGIMHYSVTQLTHEIGVRIALGARTSDVLRLIIGQGMKLTLVGMAVGLLIALWLTRVMVSLLFGVSAQDPATFAGVALLLGGVALVACYLPARKAAKVDPIIALRCE